MINEFYLVIMEYIGIQFLIIFL